MCLKPAISNDHSVHDWCNANNNFSNVGWPTESCPSVGDNKLTEVNSSYIRSWSSTQNRINQRPHLSTCNKRTSHGMGLQKLLGFAWDRSEAVAGAFESGLSQLGNRRHLTNHETASDKELEMECVQLVLLDMVVCGYWSIFTNQQNPTAGLVWSCLWDVNSRRGHWPTATTGCSWAGCSSWVGDGRW